VYAGYYCAVDSRLAHGNDRQSAGTEQYIPVNVSMGRGYHHYQSWPDECSGAIGSLRCFVMTQPDKNSPPLKKVGIEAL
jgi:hypothetical protein